jgi:hypothetical protein
MRRYGTKGSYEKKVVGFSRDCKGRGRFQGREE